MGESQVRTLEKRREENTIPALFNVPESSFNVALLGSTPKVREKSFVARSMSRDLVCGLWFEVCEDNFIVCLFYRICMQRKCSLGDPTNSESRRV